MIRCVNNYKWKKRTSAFHSLSSSGGASSTLLFFATNSSARTFRSPLKPSFPPPPPSASTILKILPPPQSCTAYNYLQKKKKKRKRKHESFDFYFHSVAGDKIFRSLKIILLPHNAKYILWTWNFYRFLSFEERRKLFVTFVATNLLLFLSRSSPEI